VFYKAVLLAVFVSLMAFNVRAEDYTIGPEDVLSISVWQHPELDKILTVSSRGMISFPPIGEIKVSGLTTSEAADRISEKLWTFTRDRAQVTVTVTRFNSRRIFVIGEVANPGDYGFEEIPDLWKVIRVAGGYTGMADLENIKVISKRGEEIVNLRDAIENGRLSDLPKLEPGDTVLVPRRIGLAGAGAITAVDSSSAMIVSVVGAVTKPGIYRPSGRLSLLQAVMMAGGPGPRAKLDEIRVIKGLGRSYTLEVNLRDYLERGYLSGNPPVDLGDTIYVPESVSRWGGAFTGFRTALQVTFTLANAYFLYRAIILGRNWWPRL